VEILHAHDETGQNEPDCLFFRLFELLESGRIVTDEGVSVTALRPFHHEVEINLIAECIVEGGDEVVFALLQNPFL
jgi:hypothetical protein